MGFGIGIGLGIFLGMSGGASAAPYSFTTDALTVDRWRADNGLTNMSATNFSGAMTQVGGAMPTATGQDGNTCWQKTKGDGKTLKTALNTVLYGPFTTIIIAKYNGLGGAVAANDTLFNANGAAGLRYATAAGVQMVDGAVTALPCTPGNVVAYVLYHHTNETRFSVNGAAWSVKKTAGANGLLQGCIFGAFGTASLEAGVDIYEIIHVAGEGGPSAAWWASFDAYAHARYPTLWPSSSSLVPFSVAPVSLGGLFAAPFDAWIVMGQSQPETRQSAAGTTPGANTFQYGKDNAIQALQVLYDRGTTYLDRCSAAASAGVAGPMAAWAMTYTAASGRPCVIVPCMLGASGFPQSGDATLGVTYDWTVNFPVGVPTRSGLFGSAVARAKAIRALGGTIRCIWEDGEAAAAGTLAAANAYSANAKAVMDAFDAAMGAPVPWLVQQMYATSQGATAGNIPIVQAGQLALASAGIRLVSTPATSGLEADNIHRNNASNQELYGTGGHMITLVQAQGAPFI